MEYKLSKEEFVAANSAVIGILSTKIENIELTNKIPIIENNSDFNKVFKDKVSILFVDISKSGNILDTIETKNKVKIYRSFIRLAVQAIRTSGGKIRQYAGDTIMGVFQDSIEDDMYFSSSKKAVNAARYIMTLIDYCLNPLLKKYANDFAIACSIGICTGDIIIAKAGMRSSESNNNNVVFDLATSWVGSTPYDANSYCYLAKAGEIFIDPKTYLEINRDSIWEKSIRVKDDNLIGGFIAQHYYLDFLEPLNINPVTAQQSPSIDFMKELFKITKENYVLIVDELINKSTELTQRLFSIIEKEKDLNSREVLLDKREHEINNRYLLEEYKSKYLLIEMACQKFTTEQIILFGKEFWIDIISRLEKIIKSTAISGFNGAESWNVSRIYLAFEMYDKYYSEICNMAKSGFPIWVSEIKIIKEKSYYRSDLIDAMNYYIKNNEASKLAQEYKKLIKYLEN